MAVHRIDLRPDMRPPTGWTRDDRPVARGYGPIPMLYGAELIGASEQPEFAAARWLLDNCIAIPTDRLETYRGDTLCMYGIVGEMAKWTVVEDDKGKNFRLRRYKPFPCRTVGSLTAKPTIP